MFIDVAEFKFSRLERQYYPGIIAALLESVAIHKRVWLWLAPPDDAENGTRGRNSGFIEGWFCPDELNGRPRIKIIKNGLARPVDFCLIVKIEIASGDHKILWKHPHYTEKPR